MIDISEFRVVETLYESDQTIVQQALNINDNMPVVLKSAKRLNNWGKRIGFLHDYKTIATLQMDCVLQPIALINNSENLVIVYNDTDSLSLGKACAKRIFHTDEIIQLFCKTAEALYQIHSQGWIHMDLSLDHILLNNKTNTIHIIDFQSAVQLRETITISPSYPRGNFETISPERTGYTNYPIDERSDLYSLGCIFYELLTNSPPFREKNPFKLIQAHINSQPVPPHEGYDPYIPITQHVPEMISQIIMKLLEKDPSKRYDSAKTLKTDILSFINGNSYLNSIHIDDHSESEIETQQLQSEAQKTLFDIFNRFSYKEERQPGEIGTGFTNKKSVFVLISGDDIIGKKALCKTLIPLAWENNGIWIQDSFSSTPDLPLVLMGRLLSSLLSHFRLQSLHELETQLKRLVSRGLTCPLYLHEMVPELLTFEDILFSNASKGITVSAEPFFLSLFQLISQKYQPVVVCLEHLERADQESLILLEKVLNHSSISFFVVGTCSEHTSSFVKTFIDKCKHHHKDFYHIPIPKNNTQITALDALNETEKELFQIASCLGNTWSVELLAQLTGNTLSEMEDILQKAVKSGLILPAFTTKGNNFWYQDDSLWKFSDDTVQQAFYETLTLDTKRRYHADVYKFILSKNSTQYSNKNIYDIARHCQYANENNLSTEDMLHLARVCMSAGERALMAGACLSATDFFKYGQSFFSNNDLNNSSLLFDLHLNALKATNYTSHQCEYKNAESILLKYAQTKQERIKAYECLARMYYKQKDYENVLKMVQKGLAIARIYMDRIPDMIIELFILSAALKHKRFNINDLDNRISEKDTIFVYAIRLISFLVRSENKCICKRIAGIVALGIKQMNKRHLTTDSAYLFVAFSRYLMDKKGFRSFGEQWSHIGQHCVDQLTDLRLQSETRLDFFWYIAHRKKAVSHHLDHLMVEINKCQYQGNEDLAVKASTYYLLVSLSCGIKLKKLQSDLHYIQNCLNHYIRKNDLVSMCRQTVYNLISGITPPHILTGRAFDEQKAIQNMETNADNDSLFLLYSIKLMLCVLFRNYEKAVIFADKTFEESFIKGTPVMSMIYCYSSLAYLGAYRSASPDEKKKWQKKIKHHIRELKFLSDQCPENAIHRYYLVLAEFSNQTDLKGDISEYYDQSIALANANQYYHDLALANELAGEYYQRKEKEKLAKSYIEDAYQAYVNWGADRKVTAYIKQEKLFRYRTHDSNFIWSALKEDSSVKKMPLQESSVSSQINHDDIWELTQSFCTELTLKKLLDKIIQTVIQYSGAHKTCLVLKKNNTYLIEAYSNVETKEKYIMMSDSIETTKHLCLPIAHQVIQTLNPICLWDAGRQGEFQYDNYIRENTPRSLLCLPLLGGEKITGLLYLENKRITHLFSPERVKRLQIIASQAAIAIKNSQFFHSQEHIMQDRSTDLNLTVHKLSSAIQDLEASSREMFLLNQFSDALHGCQTELETYKELQLFAKKLFPGDIGILWLNKEDDFFMATSWGDVMPEKNTLSASLCKCFESKTMLFIEDVISSPRCSHCGPETNSIYLCVPLKDQSGYIGVLHFQFGMSRPQVFDDVFTRRLESRRMLVCRMIEHYALSLSNLRLREALKYESMHDPLTGLFNRRHMQKLMKTECDKALEHHQSLGIIMVDIDHFKSFNDTYGHDIGDSVLIHLGKYLKGKECETIQACRYGGEEFLLLCPNISIKNLFKTAENIRLGIMNDIKVPYKDQLLDVTASLGLAMFPEHGQSMTEVQKQADLGLYKAKENGRNQVALDESQ